MISELCLNCFEIKGKYEVCPYCGHLEGAPAKFPFQLKPGTVLKNRYIIGEVIGFGGFGIIYKAYDTVLSIMVAVKEFYPAGLVNRGESQTQVKIPDEDKQIQYDKLLSRFIEEARNMAFFANEKDIMNVFAYFEENKTAYIIMEYIGDVLLKDYLQQITRIPHEQSCMYILQILEALQKLHDHHIVHRDISPDNIFLINRQQIKLFDFGAARFQDENNADDLSAVVKAGYSPPEQYSTDGPCDHRVDIYAAGALFYTMLTGHKPEESLDRLEQDLLPEDIKKEPDIQPQIGKVILKAMALNPENRYSTAREFADEIHKAETKKTRKWGIFH